MANVYWAGAVANNQCITTSGTSGYQTWIQWQGTTSSMGNEIWPVWITNSVCNQTTLITNNVIHNVAPPVTRIPEQELAHQAAVERALATADKRQKQREEAEKKAMDLLRSHLSETQRAALDKHGWFLVEGGKTKKTYRISKNSYAGNIWEVQKDKVVARYCIHAAADLPMGDQLLSQAISLMWDEEYLLEKANRMAA